MDHPPPSASATAGAAPDPSALARIPAAASLVAAVAEHLVTDPDFVFRLADELGDVICTGPLRERVRMSLASVFAARLEMHGKAIASLERVRGMLDEEWRLRQGGPLGAPTSTRELVALLQAHGVEVARGEDAVLRVAKLVLEEQRNRIAAGTANTLPGDRYSGTGEMTLAPPADTTPEEREAMRIILARAREGQLAVRRIAAAHPQGRVIDVPPGAPVANTTPASHPHAAAVPDDPSQTPPIPPAPDARDASPAETALDV